MIYSHDIVSFHTMIPIFLHLYHILTNYHISLVLVHPHVLLHVTMCHIGLSMICHLKSDTRHLEVDPKNLTPDTLK